MTIFPKIVACIKMTNMFYTRLDIIPRKHKRCLLTFLCYFPRVSGVYPSWGKTLRNS